MNIFRLLESSDMFSYGHSMFLLEYQSSWFYIFMQLFFKWAQFFVSGTITVNISEAAQLGTYLFTSESIEMYISQWKTFRYS